MSRSELYAAAIRQYLREHRSEGVTERLDEIYGADPGTLEPGLSQLQSRSLPKEEW